MRMRFLITLPNGRQAVFDVAKMMPVNAWIFSGKPAKLSHGFICIEFKANSIQHAVIHQKGDRHRAGIPHRDLGRVEIDGIAKVFGRAHTYSQDWPLARPSPGGSGTRGEVLDKVRGGVFIGHVDDGRHPVWPEILERLALHGWCERPRHVPARARDECRTDYAQPALHSGYYNAKPSPSTSV